VCLVFSLTWNALLHRGNIPPLWGEHCYDAAMSPKGTPLTDEQYAAIAWADPSESIIALSQRLG
jgi:hypothetical protein